MTERAVLLVVAIATLTVLSMGFGVLGVHPMFREATAGAGAPSAAVNAPAPFAAGPHATAQAAHVQQILAQAKADHIPLSAVSLPNLLGQARVSNGVVSPLTTIAPAPMGIGTFGVLNKTGTPTPYVIRSDSWEGTITITNVNTFMLDNDGAFSTTGGNNTFGVQLNTVTNGTTVGNKSIYDFWTQNVLYWNLVPGTVTLLDNIWNFSNPATTLTAGTLYSFNGTPVYPTFYFDFGPTIPVTLPVTIHLYINNSVTNLISTGDSYSTVRFGYSIFNAATSALEAAGVYDTVLFNSTKAIGTVLDAPFLVDGSALTPTNFLLYDAEIMIGGPGGGTTTSAYGINATEQLAYLNSSTGTYQVPPSAWNVGTDTGETVEGIAETYTTPGLVTVRAGPSIPTPFWNATPGGNAGVATFSGPLSPSNAFVFVTPGKTFDENIAAWAPTQSGNHVSYQLPPGKYTFTGMLSDYAVHQETVMGHNGQHPSLSLVLHPDRRAGVYTPLDAWNNGQLAAISFFGSGTSSRPYFLDNNPAPGGLNPVFASANDFLFPVFPGVLLAGTTAHVDLFHPSLLNVSFPTSFDAGLVRLGLPTTNNLQFEFYATSNVSLWGANGITGWFFFQDIGPTGFIPLANVVVFASSHDLVGDNTFVSQGSSLLLGGISPSAPTDNVVWGNTFTNSTAISPTMYPGNGAVTGPPIGIFAFESGDLIYNNILATTIEAYAPNANFFFGSGQLNIENWNLSMVEPWYYFQVFNGFFLGGTIVPSAFQGGNFWADFTPGSALPFNFFGFIATGGDYFPLPITAYSVVFQLSGPGPVTWSVTMNGVTQTTSASTLVFYEVPGNYTFGDAVISGGGTIAPASGGVSVTSSNQVVALTHS